MLTGPSQKLPGAPETHVGALWAGLGVETALPLSEHLDDDYDDNDNEDGPAASI